MNALGKREETVHIVWSTTSFAIETESHFVCLNECKHTCSLFSWKLLELLPMLFLWPHGQRDWHDTLVVCGGCGICVQLKNGATSCLSKHLNFFSYHSSKSAVHPMFSVLLFYIFLSVPSFFCVSPKFCLLFVFVCSFSPTLSPFFFTISSVSLIAPLSSSFPLPFLNFSPTHSHRTEEPN